MKPGYCRNTSTMYLFFRQTIFSVTLEGTHVHANATKYFLSKVDNHHPILSNMSHRLLVCTQADSPNDKSEIVHLDLGNTPKTSVNVSVPVIPSNSETDLHSDVEMLGEIAHLCHYFSIAILALILVEVSLKF